MPALCLRCPPSVEEEEGRFCPDSPLHWHCTVFGGTSCPLRHCFKKLNQYCIHCMAASPIPPGGLKKFICACTDVASAKGGLGVLIYLLRFPEKLLPPGTVDLWGSSHQLWHALIFSGDSDSNGCVNLCSFARYAFLVLSGSSCCAWTGHLFLKDQE